MDFIKNIKEVFDKPQLHQCEHEYKKCLCNGFKVCYKCVKCGHVKDS